jgi:branched-chain amino acid transport system substrate-binding protein
VIALPRQAWRLTLMLAALFVTTLSACSLPFGGDQPLAIATVFPTTGPDAAVGQAMQRAVDVAVRHNAALGGGYALTVTHFDEASGSIGRAVAAIAADQRVMGIVGPLDSQTAVTMLPVIEQRGLTTLSPGATLPGLTQADRAAAEGLAFARLHPRGKPVAFFRLPQTDDAAGKVAADEAVAPTSAHGLAAQAVFIVDDGSPSGKALVAAFSQELQAKGGTVAGQHSLTADAPESIQSTVTAIIEANPDLVFFAGGTAAGAELRSILSLTGAPQLVILTAGPIANHPGWSAAVGVVPAAASTAALLPAPDLTALPSATRFVAAYHAAFPRQALLPQSALAYDAAMDEIAAIKALIKSGKTVTRAAVRAVVAAAKYPGITGTLAFDQNGDDATPLGFSLYTCDLTGAWRYLSSLSG